MRPNTKSSILKRKNISQSSFDSIERLCAFVMHQVNPLHCCSQALLLTPFDRATTNKVHVIVNYETVINVSVRNKFWAPNVSETIGPVNSESHRRTRTIKKKQRKKPKNLSRHPTTINKTDQNNYDDRSVFLVAANQIHLFHLVCKLKIVFFLLFLSIRIVCSMQLSRSLHRHQTIEFVFRCLFVFSWFLLYSSVSIVTTSACPN